MPTAKTIPVARLLAAILVLTIPVAHAQNLTNADTSVTLNLGGSWVGGIPAGSANIAVWDATVQANPTKTLGASLAWAGIQVLNPAAPIVIGADGNTLTLGASGIDLSQATNNLTLDNLVALGANQIWQVTNGLTLTIAGAVSGSKALTLNNGGNNSGSILLSTANAYTGGTLINSGRVLPANAASFGTGNLTNFGGIWELSSFPASGVIANQITVSNTVMIDMNNTGSSYVFDGSWSGNGTVLVTNETGGGSTLTFGGNSTPGNMANFTGSIIVVTNASGTPNAGTIRFNNGGGLNNVGNSAMSINLGGNTPGGPASTVALLNRDASTTSVGELTGGPGTTVTGQTSGSGTVIWSIGGKNTSVSFGGAFVNKSSSAIAALTKVGTGTFTLTGTNTFTGAVTISAGTLQVGDGNPDGVLGGGAIANSASLVFNRPDAYTVGNNLSGPGTVTILGGGTNTYTGTNTSSGATIISNSDLVLGPSGLMSCAITVAGNGMFDVSQNPAFTLNQTLSGSGNINGALTAAGGTLYPGGTAGAGTLTFLGGLTESGGVNNQFALSNPTGTNDLILVNGNLTLTGVNNIVLSEFGGGTIPPGTYPLIAYTGALSGGTNNFSVTAVGVTGVLTNITATTPPEFAVIISPTQRGATNLTWKGDGALNAWDISSSNWVNGATSFAFQTGDRVLFNDSGAPNTNVDLVLSVLPGSVTFSNTLEYTLGGGGSINGPTGLTKTNSGTLLVLTTNSYSGPTIIGQGTLDVQNLGISGSPSAIGAASGNPTNLVFFGSTLMYSGPAASTDHGATLNGSGGTFDVVAGSSLTLNGTLTGPGALTLVDAGTVTLANVNNYTGGTVLSNGVLALGSNIANNNGTGGSGVGATNEPVTFRGGTLQLYGYGLGNTPSYNSFYNPLVVPAGQSGTLLMFPRGQINTGAGAGLNCSLSGGGTLNLEVNYVRDALSGNWSAFTGLILVTNVNASGDEMRINNTFGYANAAIFLNGTLLMDSTLIPYATINIGELGGVSTAVIGQGSVSEPGPTWCVGWKNTTNTFAGTIEDDNTAPGGVTSIIKVGTGAWYLAGQNTFTGSTTISNGVLGLTNGVNGDGSIANSTNIFINAGAILDVSGRSDGTLPLNANQVISGDGTILGILDTTAGGIVSPGGGIAGNVGTLTVTNTINLGGVTWMKLNRAASPNSDRLVSAPAGVINYGGTLAVTNIGARLQVGDTFTLFSAPTLNNSFALALPNYYTWNTSSLGVNGQISVTAVLPPPSISSVNFSTLASGTITVNAGNGVPNGQVNLLTSTNLTQPVADWTIVTSTTFDANGNLSLPVTVDPNAPQTFFVLQAY